MDFKERMRQLAGLSKRTKNVSQTSSNSSVKLSHFENTFVKRMARDNLLTEYLLKNSPKIKSSGIPKPEKNLLVENNNIDVSQKEFFKRMREISLRAAKKDPRNSRYNNPLSASTPFDREINEKIEKYKMLMEQPPTETPTETPAPETPPAGEPAPAEPPLPEPKEPTPAPEPAPEEKPEKEIPKEEKKKAKKKSQLISNVVKAVSKLTNYVNWAENIEEKINKLAQKIKRNIANEDPTKNNLAALAIILSAVDKIEDDELKEIIEANFRKYIVANEGIEKFIEGVLNKEKPEIEKESEKEEPEEEVSVSPEKEEVEVGENESIIEKEKKEDIYEKLLIGKEFDKRADFKISEEKSVKIKLDWSFDKTGNIEIWKGDKVVAYLQEEIEKKRFLEDIPEEDISYGGGRIPSYHWFYDAYAYYVNK